MLITGNKKRSIADQTGNIDFQFSLSFDNTTGQCVVGISGTRDFRFSFKSGKIYDTIGNFVQSYVPNSPFSISGQLGQQTYDYSINQELVCMGATTPTGKYSWFYISPQNVGVEFDGFVRGAIPNYYLDNAGKYYSGNYVISGRVINLNPSNKFRIFYVEVLQPSSPYSVVDFTTGDIQNTGYIAISSDQIGLSDYVVPLLLRTNFGDVPLNFTVTGDYSVVPDVYLNISPDTTNVINGVAKDYLVQFAYFPTGAYLGVELEYLSGTTGNIYFFKDQISDIQYRLLSGTVVGCARLEATKTGLVSGLDPKTLIYEQGTGTGIFLSNTVCATGKVTGDYNLKVFGLGDGFFETSYLASGYQTGLFSGVVPIQGGYLTIVGYNFLGTGDTPGVAVGYVPTGTGRYLAHPTGCLTISQNLVYDTDFYSGTLSLEKAYEGALSLPYSIPSVGWATGQFVSGRVDSMYVLNFEQGLYKFTKYYSGLISGHLTNTGNFEPTGCLAQELDVTGVITGYFSVTSLLECSSTEALPFIPITGYPLFVYDSQNRVIQPNRVIQVRPSGGYGSDETLSKALAGNYTRTKISRMGNTSSGKGYFENPVGECLSPSITGRIWKETMPFTGMSGTFDAIGNSLGFVSTRMYLTGTGDLEGSLSGTQDSGVIHFYISGSGTKAIALRGMNFGQTDRVLSMVLFRNSFYYDSWEGISIQPGVFGYSATARAGTDAYDTIGLSDLESGYYSLYVSSHGVTPPTVFFETEVFSGYECSRNILVTIKASGTFRDAACVNLVNYEEYTAHSGVNYDPIFLRYDDTGIRAQGCRALAGRGLECPGICFEAGVPDENNKWQDEVRTYSFTIPIYDNASYGNTHQFNISLSDPSGCSLGYPSDALINIDENDNPRFLIRTTGELAGETGLAVISGSGASGYLHLSGFTVTSGYEGNCPATDPQPPPPPDPCVFQPKDCDPCESGLIPIRYPDGTIKLINPCDMPDCTPVTSCCACDGGATVVAGTCPGYPGVTFSGVIPTPGTKCGEVTADGCGSTAGWLYVGEMCCSGSSITPKFAGACMTYQIAAFSVNCPCAEDGNGFHDFLEADCFDYGRSYGRRRRFKAPKCPKLAVFLSVTYIHPVSHFCASHECPPWHFSGTCYAPGGAAMPQICPPRP